MASPPAVPAAISPPVLTGPSYRAVGHARGSAGDGA